MKNPTTLFIREELQNLLHEAAQKAHIDTTKRGWMAETVMYALRFFLTFEK